MAGCDGMVPAGRAQACLRWMSTRCGGSLRSMLLLCSVVLFSVSDTLLALWEAGVPPILISEMPVR